jgi:hypothetical protein
MTGVPVDQRLIFAPTNNRQQHETPCWYPALNPGHSASARISEGQEYRTVEEKGRE